MANPQVVVDFIANTSKLQAGMRDVSTASKQVGQANKQLSGKGLAALAAGGVALGGAVKFLKSSADATEQLAKSTLQVSRVTGMDVKTSSEWASVLKTRGLSTDQFSRSMVILSKQMTAASGGSKKSADAFKTLGVSMADVRAGNTQKVIMQLSDGLSKMQNPAERAALTQQLFGRSAQKLTPLLYAGSAAIEDQLKMADRYGATLDGKSTKSVKNLIAQQREMKLAFDGVQVSLGKALLPALTTVAGVISDFARAFQPILTNGTLLKVLLGVLAAAFVVWEAAAAAAAIAALGIGIAFSTAFIWIIAIIAIVAALAAAAYLIYKNWGTIMGWLTTAWDAVKSAWGAVWGWITSTWEKVVSGLSAAWDAVKGGLSAGWDAIKNAAQVVWDWIKTNWPLLLGILTGPFGLAIAAIVTHWGAIKSAITTAVNAIKTVVTTVWNAISTAVTTVTGTIKTAVTGAWNAIQSAVTSAVNATKTAVTNAWNAIKTAVTTVVSAVSGAVSTVVAAFARPGTAAHNMLGTVRTAWNAISGTITNVVGAVSRAAQSVADAMTHPIESAKRAINKVIGAFNAIHFEIPGIEFGGGKILGHKIPKISIPGVSIDVPNIPKLARGGVVSSPTLAMVGEAGREIVAPEGLLRSIVGEQPVEVHVYIGDRELSQLVRSEVVSSNTGLARTLLAGAR